MPTPTIPAGNLFMNATTYTGTGASLAVTNGGAGASFQPDLVWIKSRSNSFNNELYDSIRGVQKRIISNLTNPESTSTTGLTSFNSNGFTQGGQSETGNNGSTYVGWQWKAGGAAVTNTAGSITASVSANTTAGFSIVRWTGTGSNGSVGHGLGVAPKMIFVKDVSNNFNWYVFTTATGSNLRFEGLNTTASASSQPSQYTTTSTLIENLTGISSLNTSGANMLVYCWAPVAGYSAFGGYTGNGDSDGPFIYTGFRPRFVIIKSSTFSGADWVLYDSSRNTYNALTSELNPNTSGSENNFSGSARMDFLSNGIKIRTSGAGLNSLGDTYVYACFAENPFKYANAR